MHCYRRSIDLSMSGVDNGVMLQQDESEAQQALCFEMTTHTPVMCDNYIPIGTLIMIIPVTIIIIHPNRGARENTD